MLKIKHLDRALKHQQLLDRAKDRREPATGEPDGEAGAPKTDCADKTRGSPPEAQPTPSHPEAAA